MHLTIVQKKTTAFILLVACINMFTGCNRFFKPVAVKSANNETKTSELRKQERQDKDFILHVGAKRYLMQKLSVDTATMEITSTLDVVPLEHKAYSTGRSKVYKKNAGQEAVLNEVHIFTDTTVKADYDQKLTLKAEDIKKIEIIEKDRGRTTASYILGALGITVGTYVIIGIIALLLKSSCPYVSTYDGEKYNLQGELFGGSIYPSLQREDYVPLNIQAINNVYQIRISNELKERQYSDFANLLVINHAANVKVLADASGKLHTISQPQAPVKALLNDRMDVSRNIVSVDYASCLFDDPASIDNNGNLYLTFNNDGKSEQAKLVLTLKNSYWFDYLYGEFTKGFGSHYNRWIKQQHKKPASELQQWSEEQNIPLTVSIKRNGEWKEVKKLKTIGPLLNREVVIPLDVPADENVEIKLSTGFMFWEVDYAAIDYSKDEQLTVQEIKPYQAIDENGANVLQGLLYADKNYLNQPKTGNAAVLKYKAVARADNQQQTVILHTSGYYEHVRDYSGVPKIAFLKGFSKAGAFAAFSKNKYTEVKNKQLMAANK